MKKPSDWKNWVALGADVGCAFIPVASGGGALVKAANKATDAMNLADKTKDVAVAAAKTTEKIAVNSATEGAIYGGANAVNQYVTTGQVDLEQVASATAEGASRRAIGDGTGLAGIKILSKTDLGQKVLNKVADVYNKIDNKLINVYQSSATRINNTISSVNPFNRVQMAGV